MLSETKLKIRLVVLGLLAVAFIFVAGGRLLGMQFVHADTITHQTEHVTSRTYTIHAARGEIFDRYGRPLVTNKLSHNVTIDPFRIFILGRAIGEREITLATRFIEAARKSGVDFNTDLFPVTPPPFRYKQMADAQSRFLEHYKEKKGWARDLGAFALMEQLFIEYGMLSEGETIHDLALPLEEAYYIAAVLYELDMRYQAMGFEPFLTVPDYVFAENVPMEFISIAREERWLGAEILPVTMREYNTHAAGHILGRIGPIQDLEDFPGYRADELVGVEGVERAFESWLRGIPGERRVDSRGGHVVGVSDIRQPQAGRNVYLTIDIRFQEALEALLAEGIHNLRQNGRPLRGLEAEAAAAVVIDVNSGAVLASVNYPTFNPSTYMEDFAELVVDPLRPLFNRAVLGTYAPGSAFKMVTAAGAIEEGIVTANERIRDGGIYRFYAFPQPRCHIFPGSHGLVDAARAIAVSCNYYFFSVGRRMGINALTDWANLFGLGLPTGLELEDPARTRLGWVASPATSEAFGIRWYPGNTLSASIGQDNNLFTPVQLANFTAAIANGGTLYSAHMLKEVLAFDHSHAYHISRPTPMQNISMAAETIEALQQGMLGATTPGGTAASVFSNFPMAVAGKTGSVQIGNRPNNGTFVAYAPFENPEIAVALVVEKGGAGSTVAPIARDIIETYFQMAGEMLQRSPELGLR